MGAKTELLRGPFLVVGLARSGVAAALALKRVGEEVVGCDAAAELEGIERLTQTGVEVQLDTDGLHLLENVATVVKSPGVPKEAPVIARAHEMGITVIGEMELAWRMLDNEFVAVTGTNGKTTTTELLGHIYRTAEQPVAVCGNVGLPVSELVGEVDPDTTVVCEASSFQLEDTELFSPEGAALLNITADHLDRHQTMEQYQAAKLNIFRNQDETAIAVAPDSFCDVELGGKARRVYFGDSERADVFLNAGQICLRGQDEIVINTDQLPIPGAHNVLNAMAAVALTASRLPLEAIREGLRTFPGVEHRIEFVTEIDGVSYINDSKATNVDSALKAIEAFPGGIHLILGGRGKGTTFESLREPISQCCGAVYLIGEVAEQIAGDLGEIESVEILQAGDLATAVSMAKSNASKGELVLLSPACASFDQFSSYEDRGEQFKKLVRGLER